MCTQKALMSSENLDKCKWRPPVHFSAQTEPLLSLEPPNSAIRYTTYTSESTIKEPRHPIHRIHAPNTPSKTLNVSNRKVLTSSREVDECKPLPTGAGDDCNGKVHPPLRLPAPGGRNLIITPQPSTCYHTVPNTNPQPPVIPSSDSLHPAVTPG
jgi:hypothetical protein